MTIELEVLMWLTGFTIVMYLPCILTQIINAGLIRVLTYRADDDPIPDWAAQAKRAHYSAIENLAPFAALVIVAHLANVSNDVTSAAALVFFGFVLLIMPGIRWEYYLVEHLPLLEAGSPNCVSYIRS